MKIRTGFVSNSSSSSFVVIGNGELMYKNKFAGRNWEGLTECGETQFGWAVKIYNSIESRVNFAVIQALSVDNQDWLTMIDEVIKEHTGATEVIHEISLDYNPSEGKIYGYIDHQSCAYEGENTEIFENKEVLKRFLFAYDSYIQGDNDNH